MHIFTSCNFLNADKESVEYNLLINFYDKLSTVFHDKNYLFHFVLAGIVAQDDVVHMCSLSDIDRAMCLLSNVSAPLESGEKQNFYKMLEIVQTHGNVQLVEDIKASVREKDPLVKSKTTGTDSTISEGKCVDCV